MGKNLFHHLVSSESLNMVNDLLPWEGEPDFTIDEAPPIAQRSGEPARPVYPYVGRQVTRKPCHWCGCDLFTLTEPKGPHSYGTRCVDCQRHTGWLSALDTKRLENLL